MARAVIVSGKSGIKTEWFSDKNKMSIRKNNIITPQYLKKSPSIIPKKIVSGQEKKKNEPQNKPFKKTSVILFLYNFHET